MTKTEMLEILRGKVLKESPEEIQARLNEIADELEQSERVVHGRWTDENGNITGQSRFNFMCSNCKQYQHSPVAINGEDFAKKHKYCHNCGAKMDEHFADFGKKVDEVSEC